jgi:hypothetical protein
MKRGIGCVAVSLILVVAVLSIRRRRACVGGVVFATVHLIGSENGMRALSGADRG